MNYCINCGEKLSNNQKFCGACGNSVGQSQSTQSTASSNNHILKQGRFYKGISLFGGSLTLYNDRLEWKGKDTIIMPISDISVVAVSSGMSGIKITLKNKVQYNFLIERKNSLMDVLNPKATQMDQRLELESWRSAVEGLRGRL
ncbi:MAG: zinc-ribbon domain-containing protein [Treponema sp.]|nr:zinc-ribbon domain-containing protein [Treponema sp.]